MIKEHLDVEPVIEPTNNSGQFDVSADGTLIASRGGNALTRILLGAGFPDPEQVVDDLRGRRG